jgi:hypothetical protein
VLRDDHSYAGLGDLLDHREHQSMKKEVSDFPF